VFIQSFEPEILKRLKGKTNAKLVQLVFEETPGAGPNIPLTEIADYADGVGPAKDLFWNIKSEFLVSDIGKQAHELDLFVHTWTFRDDAPNATIINFARGGYINRPPPEGMTTYLASEISVGEEEASTPEFEYESYFRFGVDGVFTDFPETAVRARAEFMLD
jgi:glycerophosphoryl diester phosphodiesterase